MMHSKVIRWGSICTVFLLALAACGPATQVPPATEQEAAAVAPEATVAETEPNPDELLEQALVAMGGFEKLKNAAEGTSVSKGVYMGMPYESRNTFRPGTMRMDISMSEANPLAMVMGVKECWFTEGPVVLPCTEEDGATNKTIMTLNQVATLWPLKEPGWEMTAETGEIDGKPYDVLNVTHAETGATGRLYLDRETHLPIRLTYSAKMMNEQGEYISDFKNYGTFCDVQMPSAYTVTFNGRPYMEETVAEVKCTPVDSSVFKTPEQVADKTIVDREVPATTIACNVLEGPYDGIGQALGKLAGFLQEEKLMPMGAPIMIYIKAPPKVKKPKNFLTEVCFPVNTKPPEQPTEKGEFVIKKLDATAVLSAYGIGKPEEKSSELVDLVVKEAKKRKLKVAGPMRQVSYMDPNKYPPEAQVHEVQLPVEQK